MAAAPGAAPRPSADDGSPLLAADCGSDRALYAPHRVARISLALPEYPSEHPPQFRRFARRRWIFEQQFGWRRFLRRRRFFGRWRSFGKLVMNISQQDRERISAAIRAAEAKTSGEIVCVLARTSSDATALPILLASVVALALPWLLI